MEKKGQFILGVSSFFHDSAAAIIKDGEIIAAAQEERFTRKKNDSSFPTHAISYCLQAANIEPKQLAAVAYYEKPLLKFDRLLSSYMHEAPRGLPSFLKAMPLWLNKKLHVEKEIDRSLRHQFDGPIAYCSHHQSHAASAFFPSPFKESALITFDGVGEWSTTTWGVGIENKISLEKEIRFPHSLGLLYSAFTYFLGFKVNEGEYKLMGLAPYGKPRYVNKILDNIIEIKDDGSFLLNLEYFDFVTGLKMTSKKFHELFESPPRPPETEITQEHADLAASIQKVTEIVMLNMATHVKSQTGQNNLCLAGGVALNCVGNGKIVQNKIFDHIWIQPAAGDAGGALGAALFYWHQTLDQPRAVHPNRDSQKGSLLGPSYSNEEIRDVLQSFGADFDYIDDDKLFEAIAKAIAQNQVVGFFQGRMEYGPRALGSRSILGDARSPTMQQQLNLKIKFRESFRPFAPSCLAEDADQFFELGETQSPYMLLVAPVKHERRLSVGPEDSDQPISEKLKEQRSDIPAVTHVDCTARVQTVAEETHPRFHRLLKVVKQTTGAGLVINTSFNVRDEPIVMTPEDAYRCFLATDMDVLALENYILYKDNQRDGHCSSDTSSSTRKD